MTSIKPLSKEKTEIQESVMLRSRMGKFFKNIAIHPAYFKEDEKDYLFYWMD